MSTNPMTWRIWRWMRNLANRRMRSIWKGEDIVCPNCALSLSEGNIIAMERNEENMVVRTCHNCGHAWMADFKVKGFKAEVEDEESL